MLISSTRSVHATPAGRNTDWHACQFLTCSVLPVRVACNLRCPFCFSKSSISSLDLERVDWSRMDVERYFAFAKDAGASRLVITGGGEPLLRPSDTISLIARGRAFFDEIALFTNGTFLTRELARRLQDSGLSYVCYSRHHDDDARNRDLMGKSAPNLEAFVEAADGLTIRATCVMAQGWIDSAEAVVRYLAQLSAKGIEQFTFKHTYVAYSESLFANSPANQWSRAHAMNADPFDGRGTVIGQLPWGPRIRRLNGLQVCYYYEPDPHWELENQLCRSVNLLSDGSVYASLENQRSRLFQLNS